MSIRRGSHVSCVSSIFVLRDIIVCTIEVDLVAVSCDAVNWLLKGALPAGGCS